MSRNRKYTLIIQSEFERSKEEINMGFVSREKVDLISEPITDEEAIEILGIIIRMRKGK